VRQFASSGFRLWNLPVTAKVLYSTFCLLTLAGVVSSALYYQALVGVGTAGVGRYYAGETARHEAAAHVAAEAGTGRAQNDGAVAAGPSIELPAEAADEAAEPQEPLVVPVSYRKLLEVTHFHLFTMPVVFLIVGHLFLATALQERTKLTWMSLGGAAVVLHIATPWLVRYVGAGLSWLHALSGMLLLVSMTVLTVYPAVMMWKTPGRRREEPAADGVG